MVRTNGEKLGIPNAPVKILPTVSKRILFLDMINGLENTQIFNIIADDRYGDLVSSILDRVQLSWIRTKLSSVI